MAGDFVGPTADQLYYAAANLAHLVGEQRFHRSATAELEAELGQLIDETCVSVGDRADDVRQMLEGYIDIAAVHDQSGRSCRICAGGGHIDTAGTGLEADLVEDLDEADDLETMSWAPPTPTGRPSSAHSSRTQRG